MGVRAADDVASKHHPIAVTLQHSCELRITRPFTIENDVED